MKTIVSCIGCNSYRVVDHEPDVYLTGFELCDKCNPKSPLGRIKRRIQCWFTMEIKITL